MQTDTAVWGLGGLGGLGLTGLGAWDPRLEGLLTGLFQGFRRPKRGPVAASELFHNVLYIVGSFDGAELRHAAP